MIKLLTLILLFTLNCFAQEMDPNILVNGLQNKHLTANPNLCHETDKDKILAKDCIESICGKADPDRSVYTTGEELENLKDEAIEKQFQEDLPEIKQNIEVGAKYTKKLIEELKGSEYGDISTENASYDSHTVAFLRVLREAVYKGQELSDSCLEVAKKNKHLWKFKDCSGASAGMDK